MTIVIIRVEILYHFVAIQNLNDAIEKENKLNKKSMQNLTDVLTFETYGEGWAEK